MTLARDQDFEAQALDALYLAHFAEGLDVTDFAVVVERLADAGLPDPPALGARLAAGDGEEEVAEDETIAAQIGVRAVPLVVAGRRIVLRGAQDPDVYARFLAHAIDADPPVASAAGRLKRGRIPANSAPNRAARCRLAPPTATVVGRWRRTPRSSSGSSR